MELILKGVIVPVNCDRERLDRAKVNLGYLISMVDPVLFRTLENEPTLNSGLFDLACLYFRKLNSCLDFQVFTVLLDQTKLDADKKAAYVAHFVSLEGSEILPDKFRFLVGEHIQDYKAQFFERTLEVVQQAKDDGYKDPFFKKYFRGLEDADELLRLRQGMIQKLCVSKLCDIERDKVGSLVLDDLHSTTVHGVMTGIREIDRLTFGGQPGEVWILSAYTGEGKSMGLLNFAYHACFVQSRNIVIATGEIPRLQYSRRMLTRHTVRPEFGSKVAYTHIKKKRLSEIEQSSLAHAAHDMSNNEAYGRMAILQFGGDANLDSIFGAVNDYNLRFPVDALYIDYLSLVKPRRKGVVLMRERLEELFPDLKQFALSFNNSKGLFTCVAHQSSRDGHTRACKPKVRAYDLESLSHSAEAERTADTVIWFLYDQVQEEIHEIRAGVAKNRDGEKGLIFDVYEDFSHCYISSMGGGDSSEEGM